MACDEPAHSPPAPSSQRLGEVAAVFLRLGFTAFGGPAVHVGMMEEQVVHRRKWLDRRHFLDLVSAVNFIPGPNSTELAILLGSLRAGLGGLIVAGVCFITPAVLIILPLAWMYVTFAKTPQMQPLLEGINAAVLAVIAVALWRFAKVGIHSRFTAAIALGALLMELLILRWARGIAPEIPVLLLAATAGWIHSHRPWRSGRRLLAVHPMAAVPVGVFLRDPQVWQMVGAFLKIGATLFGSGYVLLSYLQSAFVDSHGWLSRQQVLDAIAVGQFTPGPVLTTATFIGYLLGSSRFQGGTTGGIIGGLLATIAIFLPSFIFTALVGPLLNRLRQSPPARGALDAMNAAVVALITITTFRLAVPALHSPVNIAIALLCLTAAVLWKINSTWLILVGALVRMIAG